MALFIEIKAADGMVSRTRLEAGANRFSVRLGDSYRILDDQTGRTPDGIAVKRVDNNLIVDGLDRSGTVVEFPEFYNVCSAGSPCELTIENGSGSTPVSITPGTQPIGALADGSFVLYDPNFADNAPPVPSLSDGTMVRNVLYGVGGLAVVGLAVGGGGGGGGGGGDTGNRPDGSLKMTSSQFVNSRTPTITGEGEPGSRVTVRIDTDGDGVPNVTYGTTVGADFTWSINLATALPDSGTLPAGGLPEASNVGITSSTGDGIASLPTFVLRYDGTPPAPAVIDAIATDNVVNANEKQGGFVISGSAEPGATVMLSIGTQVLATTVVQESGRWQTAPLVGNSVPADGSYQLTATVEDQAGNRSGGVVSTLGINTAPPILQALLVAGGDSEVSLSDAASVGFSGRTDANATVQVQWNGGAKTAAADGSGSWTIAFTGAEVPDSAGANFPYSITATNPIGNIFVQPGQIWVDRQAPLAPVIATVEGDNAVSLSERADGVAVSGQAEAGARVAVTWGSTTLNDDVGSDGQWVVQFSPAQLPAVNPPGGPTTLSAVVRDAVDNSSAATQLAVAIEQPFAAPVISAVEGNNVVTAAEAADGVVISGNVQAGAPGVNVSWGTFSGAAAVSGSSWTVSVPLASLPPDGVSTVTATITGVGGGAATTRQVIVDKTPPAAPVVPPVTGDDSISFVEQTAGIQINGTAEAGAVVSVALGSISQVTQADAAGAWAVAFTGAQLQPFPPGSVGMSVSAYDAVGNSSDPTARLIRFEGLLGAEPPQNLAEGGISWSMPLALTVDPLLQDESSLPGIVG